MAAALPAVPALGGVRTVALAAKAGPAQLCGGAGLRGSSKLVSRFTSAAKGTAFQRCQGRAFRGVAVATATAPAPPRANPKYELPTWAHFEGGHYPLFWETETGSEPTAGELLTIWFNPLASSITPNSDFGVGFNGGFNSPIMCSGEPRIMTKMERGPECAVFYKIKINVPVHAKFMEFSFTDGSEWEGPFKLPLIVKSQWQNKPMEFFNEGLRKELSAEEACDNAIFVDAPYVQDRCLMPGGIGLPQGQVCELDIVPGCTDPASPSYNPLANIDDGSCPMEPV